MSFTIISISLKPTSITLAGWELVRSWFEPDSVMEFGFEPASVMEFRFYATICV